MALLWAACWAKFSTPLFSAATVPGTNPETVAQSISQIFGSALLCWLLVALAALDAEHFWLPDALTLPGIALGFFFTLLRSWSGDAIDRHVILAHAATTSALAILASAGLVLFIRLAYWLVRRQEGMGLGDAKLMALLGAWLGLVGAMESFVLSVLAASAAASLWLAVLTLRRKTSEWATIPLPLGTFLCAAAVSEVFYPNWIFKAMHLDIFFG
jgi:leader peptidase (prepilin peptidase)/N-methyltransferase